MSVNMQEINSKLWIMGWIMEGTIEIKRGDWQEELGERLGTAGKLLYRSVELSERAVELGEESVSIGKRMLE